MNVLQERWAIPVFCVAITGVFLALEAVLPAWWTQADYCPDATVQGDGELYCGGVPPLLLAMMVVIVVATAIYTRRTAE